jgi:hypothetical protein
MLLVVLTIVLGVGSPPLIFVSTLPSFKGQSYSSKCCLLLLCSPPPLHVDMHVRCPEGVAVFDAAGTTRLPRRALVPLDNNRAAALPAQGAVFATKPSAALARKTQKSPHAPTAPPPAGPRHALHGASAPYAAATSSVVCVSRRRGIRPPGVLCPGRLLGGPPPRNAAYDTVDNAAARVSDADLSPEVERDARAAAQPWSAWEDPASAKDGTRWTSPSSVSSAPRPGSTLPSRAPRAASGPRTASALRSPPRRASTSGTLSTATSRPRGSSSAAQAPASEKRCASPAPTRPPEGWPWRTGRPSASGYGGSARRGSIDR